MVFMRPFVIACNHGTNSDLAYFCRAGGTGPADQATAGPKLQKPTTQNFSLLFIYTLIVLYQQQNNLLFV